MIITTTEATVRNMAHTTLGVVAAERLNVAIGSSEQKDKREGDIKRMRETAIQEMQAQAEALGANAVVGVDINYQLSYDNESDNSIVLLSVSGTAVKLA